ncbi:MAG: hypothetical protein ACOCV3_02855, partial [Halanaerobiales bacterium]
MNRNKMNIYKILLIGIIIIAILGFGFSKVDINAKEANVLSPELVKVPGGTFTRGQTLDNGLRLGFPEHEVILTH